MAKKGVYLSIELDDQGTATVKNFEEKYKKAMDQVKASNQKASASVDSSFKKIGNAFKTVKTHMLGITAAAAGTIYAFKNVIGAFTQQEAAENRLAKAMANVNQFTVERHKRLKEYASELQRTSTFGDELILQEMSLLQTFGMTEEQMKNSTKATLDLASGLGIDLHAAALLVGKAFAGETGSLSRYGIVIDKNIEKTQKFDEVMKQINNRFGGAAQAEIATYGGKLKQLSNWFGDLKEKVGKGLVIAFESLRWTMDMVAVGFWQWIGNITKGLENFFNIMAKAPGIIGEPFRTAAESLKGFNEIVKIAIEENQKSAAKHLKDISDLQDENTKAIYKNNTAYETNTAAIKANNKEKEKSKDLMDSHVKLYKEWNKQLEKINQEQRKLQDEKIAAEEDFLNDLLRQGIELTDEMAEKAQFYNEKELQFYKEHLLNKHREEQKALDKTKDVLGDEADAHRDNYQSIAGFYREALLQMGDDTSSFINLVLSKLQNLAATVASEALTGITQSVLGKIPGLSAKETTPAEEAGAEVGEGAAKAAGGIASIAGGLPGLAVTGGMIGYSVLKSVLDKQKEDERKRKMRAEEYQRQLEIAAASSAQTWEEWFEGSEKLLSEKYAYAATKYGGLDDQGLKENLFKVAEIGREYKQAVEEHGDASMQAIKSYHELGMQMEVFGAQSRAWSKEGQKMAEQWEQVWEKTKQIQINEILDDINRNIGTFMVNLSKLDFLEMEEAQRATIKYEQTLRFLTDDTLRALNGELTKAREIFKEAAIEVDNLARSEEELAIKTQILRSEMELTEGQLMALRIGEVNVEMIKFYEALGWTDKELELVSVSAEEAKTGFEKMEESARNLTGTLETMAEQFRIFDQVNEDLQELYNNLVKVSVGLEMVAQAGQKLQSVPESLENIKKALEAGDLQAVNQEVQNLTNTFAYLSADLEQLGAVKLAEVAFGFTELGAAIMMVITLVQTLESAFTSLLEKNDEMADKYEQWLEDLEEKFPKIYEQIGEHLEGLIPVTPEPTIGTIGDVLGIGKMSMGEAGSVYRKYTEEPMTEEERMTDEVKRAIDALVAFRESEKKRLAEGGFTTQELDYLQSISQAVVDLNQGLKDAIDKLKAERLEKTKQFMKPFEDIIATQGMTDYEKQVYGLNRRYEEATEALKKMNLEVGDYVEMEGKLNLARKIELENLAKAQEQMIRDYWEPVIESIKNDLMALKYSSFNLAPPEERAKSAQEEYQRLKASLQGSTGEDFVKAYESFKGFYGTYLKEMQGTYKSSSKYLEAYEDVMKTLSGAETKAQQEQVSALSQFESQTLNKQNDLIDINTNIETELENIKNLNANLPENYDALKTSTETVSDRLKEIKAADVINLQEYKTHQEILATQRDALLNQTYNLQLENNQKAETRNEILLEVKQLLEDVKGNTRDTAKNSQVRRNATQSEALR